MAATVALVKGAGSISLVLISLTFQAAIGIRTIGKLRGIERRQSVDIRLKVLFGTTLIAASISTIASLVASTMVWITGDYPVICMPIFMVTTYYFFISLLATLVLRLHITFSKSIFKMTRRKYSTFIFLFALLLVLAVMGIAAFGRHETSDLWFHIGMMSFGLFFVSFFIGSALAVIFFVGNLSKLAKARVDAMRRLHVADNEIALDEHQQRLSDLSARYMMLFFVAFLSTILFVQLSNALGAVGGHDEVAFAVATPDFCINLLCLYLQFGFARDDFHRCCGCLDRKCRAGVAKRARKVMHKHSVELQSRSGLQPVDSSSARTIQTGSGSPLSAFSPSATSNTMTPPPMTLNVEKSERTMECTVSGNGHVLSVESTMENTINLDSDVEAASETNP